MIHMAFTIQKIDGTWYWYCRCAEGDKGFASQREARKDGEQHLAEANGRPVGIP